MPASAIHYNNGMTPRLCRFAYQFQMLLHHLFIHKRADKRLSITIARTHRPKDIAIIELLLLYYSWPAALGCPYSGRLILLTESCFVLKPDVNAIQRKMTGSVKDRFQQEIF